VTVPPECIVIELLSDTTFGRGEGTPGVVDVEVEHEPSGLPMLGGKALRGLLRDSWLSMQEHFPDLAPAAGRVFGPHADVGETGIVRIGDALLEAPARDHFVAAAERSLHPLAPEVILGAFTAIRSQTAEDRGRGAPALHTLRATRVVMRGVRLVAPLSWLAPPAPADARCLALAALATRHGGIGRNRGRGLLRVTLDGCVERTRELARGAT
jgi:hypothetical protein